jgi:hypothetical protein
MGKRGFVLQCLGRCVAIYICDVKSALITTLFVVSSLGSTTRGLESSSEVDDGQLTKGPKHVVDFFNSFKIQLCYDEHLYT